MCKYKDCIYFGHPDETGTCCDENQERVCEEIRKRAAEGVVPYGEKGDCNDPFSH